MFTYRYIWSCLFCSFPDWRKMSRFFQNSEMTKKEYFCAEIVKFCTRSIKIWNIALKARIFDQMNLVFLPPSWLAGGRSGHVLWCSFSHQHHQQCDDIWFVDLKRIFYFRFSSKILYYSDKTAGISNHLGYIYNTFHTFKPNMQCKLTQIQITNGKKERAKKTKCRNTFWNKFLSEPNHRCIIKRKFSRVFFSFVEAVLLSDYIMCIVYY